MSRFLMFGYCILFFLLEDIFPTYAGEWRDTFDQENLEGWTLLSKKMPKNWDSKWEERGGVLDVSIKNVDGLQIADFLRWTAIPLNAQNLTVTVHSIEALTIRGLPSGDFGVFLGKELSKDQLLDFATGYFFSQSFVSLIRFRRDGKRDWGRRMAGYFPRLQLKILFQAGHFRLFSEDVLLTDFEDAELRRINVVGLLALSSGVAGLDEFHGEVDACAISGPDIPDHNNLVVQPKGKLTTTWGKLKRF